MIEQKALAYVNMYGVLGSLENLCSMDEQAKKILSELGEPASLCFDVIGGPCCTFTFSKNGCTMNEGKAGADMLMTFATPSHFNALIDKSIPGVPVKAPVKTLKFLTGPFTKLTDILNDVLRAPEKKMAADRALFEENTVMTMYVIAGAVSALANHDSISKISASNTVDGDVQMSIPGVAAITISVKDNKFTAIKKASDNPRATMEFADLDLAHGLFAGTVSTINEMCKGRIKLAGMISMVDNINRILDRVSVYLA